VTFTFNKPKCSSKSFIPLHISIGGTSSDVANSLITTSDGGYAIAGSTDSYAPKRSFFRANVDSNEPVISEFPSLEVKPLHLGLTLLAGVLGKKIAARHKPCYYQT
jgi:hypothetical protein